jgi:hypothetical protein
MRKLRTARKRDVNVTHCFVSHMYPQLAPHLLIFVIYSCEQNICSLMTRNPGVDFLSCGIRFIICEQPT